MNPLMSKKEQDLFLKYLKQATNYFEFGSGGSTVWALAQPNIKSITSIEADKNFAEKMQLECQTANIHWIDVGKTGAWSTPKNNLKQSEWHNYYEALKLTNVTPDLILIDGRFRVACALSCLNTDALVIIHDFLNRPHYHEVLKYYDIIESVSTLVVLKKKDIYPEVNLKDYMFDVR